MSVNEPIPGHPSVESTGPPAATSPPGPPANPPGHVDAVLPIALGAGLFAGLASWAIGEALLDAFRPPLERMEVMGHVIMSARDPDRLAADIKNATLGFSVLGALLGASLGYAGGLARGSNRSGIMAALAAMVLGAVLAGSCSLALVPSYFRAAERSREELSKDLILPLLVDGGIWTAAGLAGGLGLGLGLGLGRAGLIKAGLGGLIGAALGTSLYLMVAAIIFPGENTTAPLASGWHHRLIARLAVTTLSGLLAAAFAVLGGRKASGAAD